LPESPTGILLMTYGSAANAEEVPAYLRSVRGGRDADPELVAEFQRRYRLIGWSPLVRITLEQGAELQRLLDRENGQGRYRVEVGMLHSKPTIGASPWPGSSGWSGSSSPPSGPR
jgi:protoporphyrin/coproporphyrin ferrochelatase